MWLRCIVCLRILTQRKQRCTDQLMLFQRQKQPGTSTGDNERWKKMFCTRRGKQPIVAGIWCSRPNGGRESIPKLQILCKATSDAEASSVSGKRAKNNFFFQPLFFVFVCPSSLVLLHYPFPVFSFPLLPSSHPSLASFPLTIPFCFSLHPSLRLCLPLFNLYVLPASVSIRPSRGSGPALWLIIVIPP